MKQKPIRYALVGDLIASRKKDSRVALSRRVESALAQVSRAYASSFVAPLETTRGLDEVSSLLLDPTAAFDIARTVNLLLWPAAFRFALGAGEVDVLGESGHAADMDGSAFWRAADALARAQRDGLAFALDLPDLGAPAARLVEAATTLHLAIMQDWTPGTAEAVRLYRPVAGAAPTQQQIARRLKRTQQAVSGSIRRGHLDRLETVEVAVRVILAAAAPLAVSRPGDRGKSK